MLTMIMIVDKRLIPSETITLKTSNILGLWSSWLARRVVSAKVAGSSPASPEAYVPNGSTPLKIFNCMSAV